MSSRILDERVVESWDEAKQIFNKLRAEWVFRGQRQSDWGLLSSIERMQGYSPGHVVETEVLKEFRSRAHHYLPSGSLPLNMLEWTALAQHHGAPTRLLDFSRSPYVASFFAVEDATSDCAVWAVNLIWCWSMALRQLREADARFAEAGTWWTDVNDADVFGDVVLANRRPFLAAVVPERPNERLTIQQGLFLCPGDIQASFMENLTANDADDWESNVMKIVLPSKIRQQVLLDLNYMNINRSSLFPGLDGFAQSLKLLKLLTEERVTEQFVLRWGNLPQDPDPEKASVF